MSCTLALVIRWVYNPHNSLCELYYSYSLRRQSRAQYVSKTNLAHTFYMVQGKQIKISRAGDIGKCISSNGKVF